MVIAQRISPYSEHIRRACSLSRRLFRLRIIIEAVATTQVKL